MQQTFSIESGVAIPERRYGRQAAAGPFPFLAMKPGDSFLIHKNGDGKKGLEKMRVYALVTAKDLKMQVTTRLVKGGIRVWRVK
jgi:hypothetical protein